MTSWLDTPVNHLRNKIQRLLSRDPQLPWGGEVLAMDLFPGGMEITTRISEGEVSKANPGRRTRTFRMLIEEVVE